MERTADGRMRRTHRRPLPQGRITRRAAGIYGVTISILGVAYLALFVNLLAAGVAFFTIVSYLFVYTPAKKTTWLSTLIGAVPGALPPVIGWAAVRGDLSGGAWVLFAIVYFWQIPHFLAIAWMFRAEYARAGFPVLPVIDPSGRRTSRHIIWNCLALLLVSLVPTFLNLTGALYLAGALVIGLGFLAFGVATAVQRSHPAARNLLLASIVYHPVLLLLIALDATGGVI
jgi:protoheme IX farnesyltransferase